MLASLAHAVVTYTYTLDTKTSRTTSSTGSTFTITKTIKACAGRMVATKNSGTNPTLDAVIDYSYDGSTWFHLLSFTQVTTGTVNEVVHVDTSVTRLYPKYRSVATLGGSSPNFDFTIYLDCE